MTIFRQKKLAVMKNAALLPILIVIILSSSCQKETGKIQPDLEPPENSSVLPASTQRTTGDAEAGWNYLNYGNFIGGGIPYDLFITFLGDTENLLNRTGDNAMLPPSIQCL